jgi:hypothetical protein
MTDRRITESELLAQFEGAERLGPGVWMDSKGYLHFSIPEILQHFGLPATPEHEAAVLRIMENLAAEHGSTTITQRMKRT